MNTDKTLYNDIREAISDLSHLAERAEQAGYGMASEDIAQAAILLLDVVERIKDRQVKP